MTFDFLSDSALVQSLGWTLFHSIWQIAFVAVWLRLMLAVTRRSSANFRYVIACAALLLTCCLPIATFIQLENQTAQTLRAVRSRDAEQTKLFGEERRLAEKQRTGESGDARVERQPSVNSFAAIESFGHDFSGYLNRVLPFLVWLWLAGATLFAARTIGGLQQLRRWKRFETASPGDEWLGKFETLTERVGVRQTVKLLKSTAVAAPVVVGWLKPIILIPAGALCGLTDKQLEAVLVHELMHIRRHDFLVNLFQTSIEIVLFYHPCVWWISARIRSEREFACDDATIKFYGEPVNYATALARLETLRSVAQTQQSPRLTLAATGGKLMHRIRRILSQEPATNRRAHSLWSAIVALGLVSAFAMILFSTASPGAVKAERQAKTKKMAIGFVSIPPLDRSDNAPHDAAATMQILIEKLNAHRAPAIGFLHGAQIADVERATENPRVDLVRLRPVRAEIVKNWRDAGFEIGIGAFNHIWFYDTPFDDYVANVERNERIAKQILNEKNLPLRYFSYPFLNTGKTVEDKTRFEAWLKERGLRSVKYTFDNSEWMYSFAYDRARKDNDLNLMKQIRHEYLDYMTKMLVHFEAYSAEMFGRDINQTLVLTPSRLVADTADEFFGMLANNGYEFVSMDEAQSDEAYQTPETFAGSKSGISWFERWTITQKKKLRDEPRVSQTVHKIWKENQTKN